MNMIALVAVGMLASSDFWLQNLTAPIQLFTRARAYEIEMGIVAVDEDGDRSENRIFSVFCLAPLDRASLGGLKSWNVQVRAGKEYRNERTVTFRVLRLPFGLFHTRLQIEGSIKEPDKRSPTPVRLTAIQIVSAGRVVRLELGKDRVTGDKRTWEISIKEESRDSKPVNASPQPASDPRDQK